MDTKQTTSPGKDNVNEIRLAIWGTPNAGKTVYMTMLHHYLTNFGSYKWKISIADEDTMDYVNRNISKIFDEGEFVRATEVRTDDRPTIYSYKLKYKSENEIELRFLDLPGGFYAQDRSWRKILDERGNELTIPQYLNQCHGILFLVSPLDEDISDLERLSTQETLSYFRLLGELFRNMQFDRHKRNANPLIEQYIAFGITKVDDQSVYKKFSEQDKVEVSFLELLGPQATLEWLQNYFYLDFDTRKRVVEKLPSRTNRCQFFYISPFGVHREDGQVKPIVTPKDDQSSISKSSDSTPEDPIDEAQNSSNDPYDRSRGIASRDDLNILASQRKQYKINTKVKFNPINVVPPIEWLIDGIIANPPSTLPLKNEETKPTKEESSS